MTELTRRQALAASALAGLAAAAPARAQAPSPSAAPAAQTPAATAAEWDLTELYPTDAAWESARQALIARVPTLTANKGKLGNGAAVLRDTLVAQSDLLRQGFRLFSYASLKADEDRRVAPAQARVAQMYDLYAQAQGAGAWIAPEVVALGREKVESYIAADPVLKARFAFGLRDTLRQAEHTLSPEDEALLAGAIPLLQAPGDISGQLRAASIPWPSVTLSTGQQVRLDDQGYTLNRDAPVRADRKLVFDRFWGTYKQYEDSFGASYLAQLKADIFAAKARRYPTAVSAALSVSDVPETVYRTLVTEVNAGLPQLHRYFDLRRRLLKLPDIHYYDIYPPLVSLDRRFTMAEMRTTTLAAVAPLGPDYVKRLSDATAARWMDPRPRPGKRSGAYMNPGASYDVHPYLLLNIGENYEGLSTYAHEWGHAMHTLFANAAQPYELSNYPIFTAEVASTANEQFLVAHMLKVAKTREERLFYLGQQMEAMRGTFFRQAMFAEFELAAHDLAEKGEPLSGERFSALYLDLLKRYHGPNVTIDPAYAIEWAFIPHFYNSFYVYQYATSIAAATAFAQSVLKDGAPARTRYLGALSAGGADYPVPVLKAAGVDMATPAPYRALVATFKATLDEAEALIG